MRMHFDWGIVSRNSRLNWSDVQEGARITDLYLTGPVYKTWGRYMRCIPFKKESDLPLNVRPIFWDETLDEPDALGYHTTDHGQPEAFVDTQGGDFKSTLITTTHEAGEGCADPSGNALIVAPHPFNPGQMVKYLKEICDPSEAFTFGLENYNVSDLIRPEWYDPKASNISYSYANVIPTPTTILRGGYASFIDADGQGWQVTWFNGDKPVLAGPFEWTVRHGMSLREQVDKQTRIAKLQAA